MINLPLQDIMDNVIVNVLVVVDFTVVFAIHRFLLSIDQFHPNKSYTTKSKLKIFGINIMQIKASIAKTVLNDFILFFKKRLFLNY